MKSSVTTADILQIVLIVLKLCGVITWSWWWVFTPIWLGIAIVVITTSVTTIVKIRKEKEWNKIREEREKRQWMKQ